MSLRSALVLAGRRGPDDPLAASAGVSHRALLPVCGTPMLVRVLRTLRAAGRFERIHVSCDAPDALRAVDEIDASVREGALTLHVSRDSPSRSVLAVLEHAPDEPFLVTTADHALLTKEMLHHFEEASAGNGADLSIGFVAATRLRTAYPDTTRTWLRLRDESWSGANLFAFRTARSREAARFWVRAERFRKRPWRLVAAIGPGLLAGYALGRLDLDAALERASVRIGARVRAVSLPFAEAAIDVDRESDLALASEILRLRELG